MPVFAAETSAFGNSIENLHLSEQKSTATSISANADGPHDAGSCKIDHIALPTEFNYLATSVG